MGQRGPRRGGSGVASASSHQQRRQSNTFTHPPPTDAYSGTGGFSFAAPPHNNSGGNGMRFSPGLASSLSSSLRPPLSSPLLYPPSFPFPSLTHHMYSGDGDGGGGGFPYGALPPPPISGGNGMLMSAAVAGGARSPSGHQPYSYASASSSSSMLSPSLIGSTYAGRLTGGSSSITGGGHAFFPPPPSVPHGDGGGGGLSDYNDDDDVSDADEAGHFTGSAVDFEAVMNRSALKPSKPIDDARARALHDAKEETKRRRNEKNRANRAADIPIRQKLRENTHLEPKDVLPPDQVLAYEKRNGKRLERNERRAAAPEKEYDADTAAKKLETVKRTLEKAQVNRVNDAAINTILQGTPGFDLRILDMSEEEIQSFWARRASTARRNAVRVQDTKNKREWREASRAALAAEAAALAEEEEMKRVRARAEHESYFKSQQPGSKHSIARAEEAALKAARDFRAAHPYLFPGSAANAHNRPHQNILDSD